MVQLLRHRPTKGSATDRLNLNHRVTPRLHTSLTMLTLSNSFLSTLLFFLKEFFSFVFFLLCIDDHGSFVIYRVTSVRPKHLCDQNFDHDYYFRLPFQGAECPIMWTTLYFTPCPVASFPACEPNSTNCE